MLTLEQLRVHRFNDARRGAATLISAAGLAANSHGGAIERGP